MIDLGPERQRHKQMRLSLCCLPLAVFDFLSPKVVLRPFYAEKFVLICEGMCVVIVTVFPSAVYKPFNNHHANESGRREASRRSLFIDVCVKAPFRRAARANVNQTLLRRISANSSIKQI